MIIHIFWHVFHFLNKVLVTIVSDCFILNMNTLILYDQSCTRKFLMLVLVYILSTDHKSETKLIKKQFI